MIYFAAVVQILRSQSEGGDRACIEREQCFSELKGGVQGRQTHGWALHTWYLAVSLISRGRNKEAGRESRGRSGRGKSVDLGGFRENTHCSLG